MRKFMMAPAVAILDQVPPTIWKSVDSWKLFRHPYTFSSNFEKSLPLSKGVSRWSEESQFREMKENFHKHAIGPKNDYFARITLIPRS